MTKPNLTRYLPAHVLAFMLVVTLPCLAQESRATLVGVVTDQSAAAVPMAQVTITN